MVFSRNLTTLNIPILMSHSVILVPKFHFDVMNMLESNLKNTNVSEKYTRDREYQKLRK